MKFVKKKMHEVMVQAAIWLSLERGVSRNIKVSPFGCRQFWVTLIFGVTHVVPHNLRPCANATSSWMVRKVRKSPLLAESESLQKLFVDLHGHI